MLLQFLLRHIGAISENNKGDDFFSPLGIRRTDYGSDCDGLVCAILLGFWMPTTERYQEVV